MTGRYEWQDQALCTEHIELFDAAASTHRHPDRYHRAAVRDAKLICEVCPVAGDCLTHALHTEHGEWSRWGVRGGLTEAERDQLTKEVRRSA
jgi:hypothetical protein